MSAPPPRANAPRRASRDFRGTFGPVGMVVVGLGLAILVCAAVGGAAEYWIRESSARDVRGIWAVAIAGLAALVSGAAMNRYGHRHRGAAAAMTRREATLAVALIWAFAGVFGGLPFVIGAGMNPADAFFEAVSGLTTTGATVIPDIEGTLSHPLLLWRSVIQWLGGMGIVVLFVAVFPTVGVGAKHMFKGEVPGTSAEGLAPRIAETSFTLWKIYLGLTMLLTGILFALGMSPFESVCHALTTMATGGFSTRDASIAAFESAAIEWVLAIFMLIGSVNYALYHAMLRNHSFRVFLRSTELLAFSAIVIVSTIALTIGILHLHGNDPLESFRHALFTVAAFISSTGFATASDYMSYPNSMVVVLLILMFVGGCSGSTAGGFKVERIVLLGKMAWAEIHKSFRPALIRVVRMGRTAVPQDVLMDVAVLFGVFMLCLAGGVVVVTILEPVTPAAAFGATLTCLSNIGPAPFHDGVDNFASYSDTSKVFFALAMLLGRLEFFTMFALLVPDFWRR